MLTASEKVREASGRKSYGITDWESRREKGLDNMINCPRAEDIQTEPRKDTPSPKAPTLLSHNPFLSCNAKVYMSDQ